MRLAIYQPRVSYYIGGGEVTTLMHAKYLSTLGHDVSILTSIPPYLPPSDVFATFKRENPQITIEALEIPNRLRFLYDVEPGQQQARWDLESLAFGREALPFLEGCNFDLITTHYTIDALYVPEKFPHVLHLHGVPQTSRSIDQAALNIPDALVGVSQYVIAGWKGLYSDMPPTKLLYNAVDTNRYKSQKVAKDIDILYVGRLIATKGVQYLIQAFARINDPACKLVVAGRGPFQDELTKLTNKLDLGERVKFLGYVQDKELPGLYNRSQICVFPSFAKEGVLTTMLEAAASGVCIVASNCCGLKEFIEDQENGFLFEPGDVAGLSKILNELLLDRKLTTHFGTLARRTVEKEWAWEKRIIQVEEFYQQVVATGKKIYD